MLWILPLIDTDPDWEALHNLYVVAARIFGRKQAEERPGSPGHVFDYSAVASSERVDVDRHWLAGMHMT